MNLWLKRFRIEIKYALFSAAVLILWTLLEHFLGLNTTNFRAGEFTRLTIPVVVLIFLFLGTREKRNKEFNGELTFWQGLKTVFFLSLFYAVLQGFWFEIYSTLINPGYAALTLHYQETKLVAEGKTPQEIADRIAFARKIFDGGFMQYGFFFLSTTIINTAIGAIMTLFLRRQQPKRASDSALAA